MTKPYSTDLRVRVVEAVDLGPLRLFWVRTISDKSAAYDATVVTLSHAP